MEQIETGTGSPQQNTPGRTRRRATMDSGSGKEPFFQPVSGWLWFAAALTAFWGCFTPNALLTAAIGLSLPLLCGLLRFRGDPPVLLFACCVQWMEASMDVFYANFHDHGIDIEPDLGGAGTGGASWLTMLGVLVLALGMRVALLGRDRQAITQARSETASISIDKTFFMYLVTFVFSAFIGVVAFIIPGLAQPLFAFALVHWVMVFVLVYAVLVKGQGYGLLGLVVFLEVLVGVTGFFAGFKDIFYVLMIALAGSGLALSGARAVQLAVVVAMLFGLAITWTTIKADYRDFVNEGTGAQSVNVSLGQRLHKLDELVTSMTVQKFEDGLATMCIRIGYVHFFAATMENVPANVPYEHGQMWWGAIQQALMPRLFFPDKPMVDDSARTLYYAGVNVAGMEQNTSISIGYIGESYIDFGPVGMFAPIFLLGIFYGLIYRLFIKYSQWKILGLAIPVAILTASGCELETSNVKVVGGNLVNCLAMIVVLRYGGAKLWGSIAALSLPSGARGRRGRGKPQAPINNQPTAPDAAGQPENPKPEGVSQK